MTSLIELKSCNGDDQCIRKVLHSSELDKLICASFMSVNCQQTDWVLPEKEH